MKKIDFYILRKFIGTFFFAVSLLMVIIIVFDLSENIDAFLKHDAPWQIRPMILKIWRSLQ